MPQNHIWDIQWHFAIIKNKGLSITPNTNLVKNIGFGEDATHTKRIENWNLRHSAHKLETFKKPSLFEVENEADEYTMANHFKVYQIYNQSIIDTQKMNISKKQYIKNIIKSILPPFIIFLLKKFFSASNKENQSIDYQNNVIEENQLPRYTVFETLFLGNKLKVLDNASFDFMNKELFETEIYKFNTSTESPYIIDCGANIGLAIIYFKQIYPDAEILAFEPDPKVFDALKFNIQTFNFDNVTLINKAVWNKVEILKFYSEGADGGRKALVSDSDNIIEVQTVQLRDYITQKVDFLKIDIEGAEYEVLKDISDLLHNVERIFVEYHSFVGQSQHIPELLEIIKNAGFRLHISSPGFSSNSPFLHLTEYAQMDNQLNIFGFR
jgi:FkbM family methyltransferase